jgi:hypothetical protein
MSASAAQIQRRRAKSAAATKARKTRIRAIVLVCIFVLVVAFQGPRTWRMISGGDATTAAAPAPEAAAGREPEKVSPALLSLRRNPGADPFATRALTDRDSRPGSLAAPAGTHDPFAPRGGSAQPVAQPQASQIVVGTPTRSRVATRSFIVILASVPTSRGWNTATRFARAARASGVGSIGVVESSLRNPLRPGYYVVYLGSYRTLRDVTAAVARAHRYGFRGAYQRQLVRY